MTVETIKKMSSHKYFIKWRTDCEDRIGKLGVIVEREIIENLFLS